MLNDDAAWSWFEDERAIVSDDVIYVGSVAAGVHHRRRAGDIEVTSYDLRTGGIERVELFDRLEVDDHDSPALIELQDGTLLAAFTKHNADGRMYMARRDGQTGRWQKSRAFSMGARARLTYANLMALSGEGDTVYNFFRGVGGRLRPSYATSSDGGRSWQVGQAFIRPPRGAVHRPYLKYASNGVDTIHIVFTEGHPRDYDCGLYHMYYRDGRLHRSDGTAIARLSEGLQRPEDGTLIFKGGPDAVAWPVDLELDLDGFPRVVYSVQRDGERPSPKTESDLRYRYARWDGKSWHDHSLGFAGTQLYVGEDDYSGLAALDPRRTDVVYLSSNSEPQSGRPLRSAADGERHYEIYRASTGDGGASWRFRALTTDSQYDNIRPVVPRGQSGATAIMWLHGVYRSFSDYDLQLVLMEAGLDEGGQ